MPTPNTHPELPGLIVARLISTGGDTYRLVAEKTQASVSGETWLGAKRAAEFLGLPWSPGGGCESLRRLRFSEIVKGPDRRPVIRFRKITRFRYEYELNSLADHKRNAEVPGYWDTIEFTGR